MRKIPAREWIACVEILRAKDFAAGDALLTVLRALEARTLSPDRAAERLSDLARFFECQAASPYCDRRGNLRMAIVLAEQIRDRTAA
jgi:hypothetical protein